MWSVRLLILLLSAQHASAVSSSVSPVSPGGPVLSAQHRQLDSVTLCAEHSCSGIGACLLQPDSESEAGSDGKRLRNLERTDSAPIGTAADAWDAEEEEKEVAARRRTNTVECKVDPAYFTTADVCTRVGGISCEAGSSLPLCVFEPVDSAALDIAITEWNIASISQSEAAAIFAFIAPPPVLDQKYGPISKWCTSKVTRFSSSFGDW